MADLGLPYRIYHRRCSMSRSNLALLVSFCMVVIGLLSCSQKTKTMLKVESDDTTRANAPFLLAYVSDDGTSTTGPILVPKQTPFEMEVTGTNYLILLSDTASHGPTLRATVERWGASGVGIVFHRSSVYFKGGKEVAGTGSL